jgi:hypothetical protein
LGSYAESHTYLGHMCLLQVAVPPLQLDDVNLIACVRAVVPQVR